MWPCEIYTNVVTTTFKKYLQILYGNGELVKNFVINIALDMKRVSLSLFFFNIFQ